MKKMSLVVVLCLILTTVALAQGKGGANKLVIQNAPADCSAPPVLSSDGVVTSEDFIAISSSAYYTINVKAGHSYSIEVWDPFDPVTLNIAPVIDVLTSGCGSSIKPTDVTAWDPDFSGGFARRVSWVQATDATLNISVTNPDPNFGYTYYIRTDDTTLTNPRWSTYSGYDTQWGLYNTTNKTISGTLKVINVDGTLLATVPVTAPAGLSTFVIARASGVPADHVGNAVFTFIGPPGGILADAYFLSADAKTIVPTLFVNKHAYH